MHHLRVQTFVLSISADRIRFVAGPAMMAELALRVDNRGPAFRATIDEFRPTQYTKEMAFQDMGKVTAGWTKAILVSLFVFANHRKYLKKRPKNAFG